MYRCKLCREVVPRGSKLLRHVVKRPDGQIKEEIPVCPKCSACLKSGYTPQQVASICGPRVERPAALAHLPRQAPITNDAPPVKKVLGVQ